MRRAGLRRGEGYEVCFDEEDKPMLLTIIGAGTVAAWLLRLIDALEGRR